MSLANKLKDALLHPGLSALEPEERAWAEMLVSRGWSEVEAAKEVKRALADAAEEDGYDGP